MSNILIYNTLTDKKEQLPKTGKRLNLFVCGPTVYDLSHLGHARTYIAFDVIVRYLRQSGYKIFYLQNITDIDDKIIHRAEEDKKDAKTIARQFEKEYLKDMKTLNVASVNKYARASAHMKEIRSQIERLIEKGFAYRTKNGVYFEVKKLPDYGKLSRQNLDELRAGYRIEPDQDKRDPLDFALWKIAENDPVWKSPWGKGRPGWHIEDTAITEKIFKSLQYDLHGGGIDLKFPHHECEIAQSEAISGKKPFVKLWMHTGHLLVGGQKMSKSLGNFITIRDFLKSYSPNVLRLIILQHHYRTPIDYNGDLAGQAKNSLSSLSYAINKLLFVEKHAEPKTYLKAFEPISNKSEEKFNKAMGDDFNTPVALSAIFSLISRITPLLYTSISKRELKASRKFIQNSLKLLGIDIELSKIPQEISDLGKKRDLYRNNQQFTQADALRKKIESLGYKVEDTPLGSFVSKA